MLSVTCAEMMRCVCAALPPPRRSTSVFTSTQVQGAGKQTLLAVMFDPKPRARQGSGEGLSGHWDWPQGCGGGGLVGSSLGCLISPLRIEVQTAQRLTLLNHQCATSSLLGHGTKSWRAGYGVMEINYGCHHFILFECMYKRYSCYKTREKKAAWLW